jgi:hypothetical protein
METDANEITEEEIADAVEFELETWAESRISPDMVTYNIHMLDAIVAGLKNTLIAAGITTEDEFTLSVNRIILSNLRTHRARILEEVTKARILQGITPQVVDQFGQKREI